MMMRFLRLGVGHKLGGDPDSRRPKTAVALDVSDSDESDVDNGDEDIAAKDNAGPGQNSGVNNEDIDDERESDLERVMQNAIATADDEDADGWNSSGEY